MHYCLFKMKFSAPLHIGDSSSARSLETQTLSLCADTIFSAMCHTAPEEAENLANAVRSGRLLISDAFPYQSDVLYIPKPYITSAAKENRDETDSSVKKKMMKKLKYIPISMLTAFFDSIRGTADFSPRCIDHNFGEEIITMRAGITGNEKTQPYSVAAFSFREKCGLYFIIGCEDIQLAEQIQNILVLLGLNGIGGKVSSGLGKFSIVNQNAIFMEKTDTNDVKMLLKLLRTDTSDYHILMTSSLPKNQELDQAMTNASYSMIRRGGFIFSPQIGKLVKKDTQFFFASGSVFQNRFEGELYNVCPNEVHPIYRYAKPMFLGVNI